ncbi:MAG: BrnA antitoxin family protein [Chloroflexota bacterium]|nr:BrnA antitoxin family protein [Chloroflexota bacterium]
MKKSRTLNKSLTDWARLDALEDEDTNMSDIPEITPEMFAKAVVRCGLKPVAKKAQVTLRLDSDVLGWFKTQGHGYQTRINTLLRAYMQAHEREAHAPRQRHARGLSASSRR